MTTIWDPYRCRRVNSRGRNGKRAMKRKQLLAERQATLKREREASRPIHQFLYHVLREVQGEIGSEEIAANTTAANIYTKAYETVKSTWIRRGIWNRNWGILPGMSWKHEQPLGAAAADSPPAPLNPLEDNRSDAGEAPPRPLFAHLRETDPRQTPSVVSSFQRGQPMDNPVELANGDAERSVELNTPPRIPDREDSEDTRPATGQMEHSLESNTLPSRR